MWRFLLQFIFIASVALGQQSVIVTFGRGDSNDNSREGDTYNVISRVNDNGYSTYEQLKCTDGSTSPITLTVGVLNCYKDKLIQSFSGTNDSIDLINKTFNNVEICGYTNIPTYHTIITFKNIETGSYTLSVLVANGTTPSAQESMIYHLCDKDDQPLSNVTAYIIASTAESNAAVENKGTAVTAYAAGSKQTATAWALFEYSFEVTDELSTIKLRSSSTCGNVAALKLTAIPEPSAAALSVITFASLALRRRRK